MEEEHSDVIQKLEEELRKERQRMITITGSIQGEDAGKNMLELLDALQSEKQVKFKIMVFNTIIVDRQK